MVAFRGRKEEEKEGEKCEFVVSGVVRGGGMAGSSPRENEAARAPKKRGTRQGGWCENRGQGLRLGTQVKGVRSAVFWTVSIVSGLFIRDSAVDFAFSSGCSRRRGEDRAKMARYAI